jgi:hypothetical protein
MRTIVLLAFVLVLSACGSLPPALNPPAGEWSLKTFDYGVAHTLALERPYFSILVGELQSNTVWTTVQVEGDNCFHAPLLRNGYRLTACVPPKDSWYDKWKHSQNVFYCTYQPQVRTFHFPLYICR